MAKKAKAQAKRERRIEGRPPGEGDDDGDEEDVVADGPKLTNDQIMEKVAELHRRYDDGQMDLDTFDEERAALMAQISID